MGVGGVLLCFIISRAVVELGCVAPPPPLMENGRCVRNGCSDLPVVEAAANAAEGSAVARRDNAAAVPMNSGLR